MATSGKAYRFIIAFITFILLGLLWIPLDYVFGITTTTMNSLAINADTIQRNNIVRTVYYYALFIILIVLIIYVLKPDTGETEQGEVMYVPYSPY